MNAAVGTGSVLMILMAFCSGCGQKQSHDLTGAWRAKVQFNGGAFASIKDLEFMYVFNAGGTLTESSNYDAAPPVPPAYGIWGRIDGHRFEAEYEFFVTRVPDTTEGTVATVGWLPAGRGVFLDTITMADDGRSFTSKMRYEAFDKSEKVVEGGGEADGRGIRVEF